MTDFTLEPGQRSTKPFAPCVRVLYKADCIAIADDEASAQAYIRTHGYAAEHRRQWNAGNRINWSEALRVGVEC